jgi:hypothetical protein
MMRNSRPTRHLLPNSEDHGIRILQKVGYSKNLQAVIIGQQNCLVQAFKERIVPLLHSVPIQRVYEMARSLAKMSDKWEIEIIFFLRRIPCQYVQCCEDIFESIPERFGVSFRSLNGRKCTTIPFSHLTYFIQLSTENKHRFIGIFIREIFEDGVCLNVLIRIYLGGVGG